MYPDSFEWETDRAEPGVARRHLGSFTERRVALSIVRLDAGAVAMLPVRPGTRLYFALSGDGAAGDRPYRAHSAWSTEPNEPVSIRANAPSEIFVAGLPIFG
jgi:hypothetical protein